MKEFKEYLKKQAWKDVLTVVVMVFFVLNFVGFRAVIPSGSMLPTLQIGKSYFVSIFTTFFRENKGLIYEDIVVFTHEEEFGNDDLMVKRVIGLPGDEIELSAGKVYRNGEYIEESYVIYSETDTKVSKFTVPEDEIFVMGDNRKNSLDGRFWEDRTVSLDEVVGEMWVLGQ